ncbi:MAG: hypothetical protein M0R80_03340 [Proteobacteria bacterium]|jgi:hypothetical protein|nr:hypothetical protein [Pseudomonadota bacterium]
MAEQTLGERIDDATEIGISFDTTGSMRPCIADVRKHLEETCEGLFANIPGLKMAFISHGDYCDGQNCIRVLKLTNDRAKIFDFIRNAPDTSGGDCDECYELVLHEARDLGWTPGVAAAFVMIGDADPHDVNYPQNEGKLNWRQELAALKEMGVRVFPLQCLNSGSKFWANVAQAADTKLMLLNEFTGGKSARTMEAMAFAAAGSKAYADYESRTSASCDADEVHNRAVLRATSAEYDALHKTDS